MASLDADQHDMSTAPDIDELRSRPDTQLTSAQASSMNSNSSSDEPQEEEDHEELDHFPVQDGQSFIGVAISAEQTRLASPSTPAAEKAAAIGNDPFAAALQKQTPGANNSVSHSISGFRDFRFSSYGERANSNQSLGGKQSTTSFYPQSKYSHRPSSSVSSSLKNAVSGRQRASTGPSSPLPDRGQRKLFPLSLPKLPGSNRISIPSVESALSFLRHPISHYETNDSGHRIEDDNFKGDSATRPRFENQNDTRPDRESLSKDRPPLLRRSTSDGSLYLMRAQSRASSLGDDSRFENVHEQLNSRAKAIRDSIVDANFRLPRLKTSWLDFNSSNKSGSIDSSIGGSTDTRDFGHSSSRAGDLMKARGNQSERLSIPFAGSKRPGISPHSQFSRALEKLTGDVVILGGYRGSILRDADTRRQVWVPIKVGLGVRKVNLEVGLEPEDEEYMPKSIYPGGMLRNIGPVDISRRLFKRLMESENVRNGTLRVHDYGYDWRLSPELLSRQLQKFLEGLASNQEAQSGSPMAPLIIAHSLGGMIARHAINNALKSNKDLVSGIIYAGVPQTCVNILGPLRNGDDVFLSSKVLTAQVNFTIRTSYALLPLDGACFVDRDTREEYRVDFFDPKTWEEYSLSPCISRPLPPKPEVEEPRGMMDQLLQSMANALPSISILRDREAHDIQEKSIAGDSKPEQISTITKPSGKDPLEGKMDNTRNPQEYGKIEENTVSTAVTIKKEDAMKYLARTLQDVKRFKEELAFNEDWVDRYPPSAVIYGKEIPTVSGALVRGREGIKHADAYSHLAFASGDGVVLARAAQLPEGYHAVKGGVVSSDRGHISLLGDLEAVGQCINAIVSEQRRRLKHSAVQQWSNHYKNE